MTRWCAVVLLAAACGKPAAPPPAGGPPQRIVSQTVLSDALLWMLGPAVRERVVAVSSLADDEDYSAVAGQWPSTVQRAPGNSEALLAAQADLVIIADFTAVETQEMLTAASIRTLTLTGFSGFSDFRRNATAVAQAVGATREGDALRQRFDAELARRKAPPPTAASPSVVSWAAGNVAGDGTSFDDVATAAGLRNLASAHGVVGHKPIAVEQLVAWDPAMVVVACEGSAADACAQTAARVATQPGIAATRAGRHGGVVALEPRILYSAGWAMLDAVSRLRDAAQAHGRPAPDTEQDPR